MPVLDEAVEAQSTSAEVVVIVEDDRRVSELLAERFAAVGLPVSLALSVDDGCLAIAAALGAGVRRIAVLLDLMFDRYDPNEGLELLVWLSRRSPGEQERVNVVVRTSAIDADTRRRALDAGAKAFHAKSSANELARTQSDVLTYVGRDGLVSSQLVEVVDIDEAAREMEIRYVTSNSEAIRGVLDLEFVPRGSCVPGGSFWLDTYRRFESGGMVYSNRARLVDAAEDERILRQYLP
jgi:CheY-like chemotaxis protein